MELAVSLFFSPTRGRSGKCPARAFELAPETDLASIAPGQCAARLRASEALSQGALSRYEHATATGTEEVENSLTQLRAAALLAPLLRQRDMRKRRSISLASAIGIAAGAIWPCCEIPTSWFSGRADDIRERANGLLPQNNLHSPFIKHWVETQLTVARAAGKNCSNTTTVRPIAETIKELEEQLGAPLFCANAINTALTQCRICCLSMRCAYSKRSSKPNAASKRLPRAAMGNCGLRFARGPGICAIPAWREPLHVRLAPVRHPILEFAQYPPKSSAALPIGHGSIPSRAKGISGRSSGCCARAIKNHNWVIKVKSRTWMMVMVAAGYGLGIIEASLGPVMFEHDIVARPLAQEALLTAPGCYLPRAQPPSGLEWFHRAGLATIARTLNGSPFAHMLNSCSWGDKGQQLFFLVGSAKGSPFCFRPRSGVLPRAWAPTGSVFDWAGDNSGEQRSRAGSPWPDRGQRRPLRHAGYPTVHGGGRPNGKTQELAIKQANVRLGKLRSKTSSIPAALGVAEAFFHGPPNIWP
ncbi:hypothetical protein FQR65_LT20886 [Abscondita terminalis]|nr:hypothetical protein FQR65_LT20886 [Abscondita terminalis]